ncbi:MAG: peptide MFS transporter [Bacteroidia bacterium]|nr:peptide MFS transporter [Bacteroidia bacterium]MDW8158164.1 peptide MFS transporter [Bacteroidia bacterium]
MNNPEAIQSGKHPKGLYWLFGVEMWERFSYYGMRGILILYLTKVLMFDKGAASLIYGACGSLVYAAPVLGGFLADKFLGYRMAIILGGIIMFIGQAFLATPGLIGIDPTGSRETVLFFFLAGQAMLAIGNGFFKPNISSLVGKLYAPGDPMRDRGFTIFYLGINLGALIQLISAVISSKFGFHFGFLAAGLGMLIGLTLFILGQKSYGPHGYPPDPNLLKKQIIPGISIFALILLGTLLSVPIFMVLIYNNSVMSNLLITVAVVVLGIIIYTMTKSTKVERERLLVILILIFFSTLFWAFFEQAGSSINLFTDQNVNKVVLGWEIPTAVFQSVNPAFIVLLGSLFTWLWGFLDKRGLEPNTPLKFALGILQLGLGFVVLGLSQKAHTNGIVPLYFLILGYLLHTTGELCLSPVGLSMVTKLSPPKLVGFIMGAWFLSSAFAHNLGGIISKIASSPEGQECNTAVCFLQRYCEVFMQIGYVAVGTGIFLAILSPLIRRWMHGIK